MLKLELDKISNILLPKPSKFNQTHTNFNYKFKELFLLDLNHAELQFEQNLLCLEQRQLETQLT